MASGVAAFAAACASPATGETRLVDDPALGRVYQWEKDDLLVLASGLQPAYRPGDEMRVKLLLNNQKHVSAEVKIRTRLLGRGQQAVVEAEVVNVEVPADGVLNLERPLRLPRSLPPQDYALQVELPPWTLAGNGEAGGGSLMIPVQVVS